VHLLLRFNLGPAQASCIDKYTVLQQTLLMLVLHSPRDTPSKNLPSDTANTRAPLSPLF
jgi:hypothetical protein